MPRSMRSVHLPPISFKHASFSCFIHDFYKPFSVEQSINPIPIPALSEQHAQCFLVDAEEYRSVDHRLDETGLKIYRFVYNSYGWGYLITLSIACLHCLAFLEYPSSLSRNSTVSISQASPASRVEVSPSITYVLEAVFLVFILMDSILQVYLSGIKNFRKNPWLLLVFILMIVSWIDLFVSIAIHDDAKYFYRIRRFFRPFFAMQKSQLMKKVLKSLRKTVVDIFSAFLLLTLWLLAFSLIAICIFNGFRPADSIYPDFYSATFSFMVLLTTANNPDVMQKVYSRDRLAFVFYAVYMMVGIFVFMNVLIAIVYNEFRTHVLDSMQTSLNRRRVATRSIFEVLKGSSRRDEFMYNDDVETEVLRRVITIAPICSWRKKEMIKLLETLGVEVIDWKQLQFVLSPLDQHKESQMVFHVPRYSNNFIAKCQKFFLSRAFEIIGLLICFVNVVVIAIDVTCKFPSKWAEARSLEAFNWLFILIYILEQSAKFFSMGLRMYFSKRGCIFDFLVTVIILSIKIVEAVLTTFRDREDYILGYISIWDLPRVTNLLILARTARIVLFFPSLVPMINTLFDIPWRMKSVIGLISLLFYLYALLGMNIFQGTIDYGFMTKTSNCGTYQQLEYGAFNFNDFYSSIVVLWCLLIVNNWQVFMEAFADAVGSRWIHLYMISWWIISVIIVMNCVTAFVIEAYTQRKSYYDEERVKRRSAQSVSNPLDESVQYLRSNVFVNNSFTFQMLFSQDLVEPTEEELLSTMKTCQFLCEFYPHIAHSHYES